MIQKTAPMSSPLLARCKTPYARFLVENLNLEEATGVPGAVWSEMALAQMNTPDDCTLAIHNKCRQTGWSFNESAIAVARAILVPRSVTVFVSYNQEESQEKIEYAARVIEFLRPSERPRCDGDSKTEIRLANGSRLKSLPCREPRGKGQPRIVLDEMSEYPRGDDMKILVASIGATMRSGCIRIGATPKPVGLHRELADETNADPKRDALMSSLSSPPRLFSWPWWTFSHLCKPELMYHAKLNATTMSTEERVARYGTKDLHDKYSMYQFVGNMAGFQQETECAWVAESAQLIPEHLVTAAVTDYEYPSKPPPLGITAIGADFGRRQDMTAYVVLHSEKGRMRVLDIQRIQGEGVQQQADALSSLIQKYKPFIVPMDVTDGFGQAVMDLIKPKHPFVKPITFSSRQLKEEMMSATMGAFVNHAIDLPADDPIIARDIASVRKVHTAGGGVKFEAPRDSKGHADSFFALAMAINELPRADAGEFEYTPVVARPGGWSGRPAEKHGDWEPRGGSRIAVEDYGRLGSGNDWNW